MVIDVNIFVLVIIIKISDLVIMEEIILKGN